jgi:hypothetical protein
MAGAFIGMVQTKQEAIRTKKLHPLGERACRGGGDEFPQFVEEVKAGQRLRL